MTLKIFTTSRQIRKWLVNQRYEGNNCGASDWEVVKSPSN